MICCVMEGGAFFFSFFLFKFKEHFLNVRLQFFSEVLNPGLGVAECWTQTSR